MKCWTYWIAAASGLAFAGIAPTARAAAQTATAGQTPAAQKNTPPPSSDDETEGPGPWLGRIRGYDFSPAGHSNAFNYLGLAFQPNDVLVSQKFNFEGDISYFFKKWLAMELSVSSSMTNNVTFYGGGPVGSFAQMPMSLTIQYHVQIPKTPANAYVGIGMDYSHITSVNLNAGGSNPLSVRSDMVGFTYQLGVDVALAQGFYLNLDFRHMQLATNVTDVNTGTLLTDMNMTPNFYSIGLGYRF